jgi:ubiquinone/menaquinone biosynthesis C-methylase UbiE
MFMNAELSPTFPSAGIATRLAGWLLPGQYSQDWAMEQLNILPYQHLLEIGYGSGKMLQSVAKKLKVGFLAGIDDDVTMYQRATRRNRRIIEDQLAQLHFGSLYQLPYPPQYFHTVYGTNIHLSWKDPEMEFLRLSNLLRTGGRLVTILQPDWSLKERTLRTTMDKIQEHYIAAGLSDIRIRYKDADLPTGVAITGFKA